jgi:leader peptidase (prepilin peptidase)/N-methyltransferase
LIESIYALLFGLLIGSFLNVCIHRWPRGRSVVKPRSHCVRCRKPIAWYDNIPVVSYVVLGGACRHCGRRISFRYPFVELATGICFFYFVWTFGPTVIAVKFCVFAAMLIALAFSDLEKRLLPDQLTKGGTVIGLIFAAFVPVRDPAVEVLLQLSGLNLTERTLSILVSAIGACLPAFFLWFGGWVYEKIRHQEGLGFGDVKLVAMVGSFLGLQGALFTLIVGSVSASIIGILYIKATGQDASKYQLPFGTFLCLAALVAATAGQGLMGWYVGSGVPPPG